MEMDKENSMSKSIKKKCTKCLAQKKPSEFYLQASGRPESLCKECKKVLRRKRYVGKEKREGLSRLVLFIDVMLDIEIENLRRLNEEADYILKKQKKAFVA